MILVATKEEVNSVKIILCDVVKVKQSRMFPGPIKSAVAAEMSVIMVT